MTGPAAGFDAAVARWLRDRAQDPTASDTTVAGVRAHARAVNARSAALLPAWPEPAAVRQLTFRSPRGATPARVYEPAGPGPFPVVVFFHGGGWIAGDLDTHDQQARRLCVHAGCVVLAVDYRLAPEHPFPAAYDDALAATRWAAEHIGELSGDPSRLAVAGDSAGGQLAASVAIGCRDHGPPLAAQLLIVPVTDVRGGYADPARTPAYPSRHAAAHGFGLTMDGMREFAHAYAASDGDWRVSPMAVPDAAGLAPAIVHTAGFDPLRDEGAAYARRLAAAGVPVTHRDWPTLNHGFFGLGGVAPAAERAAAQATEDLRDLVSR